MSGMALSEFADALHELMSAMAHEFVRRQENEITRGKITITQLLIMELLMKSGESKMTDLARFMGVSTPAITGIVERLVKGGYVSRLSEASDRRIIKIALNAKGAGVVKKIHEQRREMIMKLFGRISQKEREDYLRILTRIRELAGSKKA
jgi:MarR family transcriptional regulator, 2-MHQ and catechol-resistance regulon repressor